MKNIKLFAYLLAMAFIINACEYSDPIPVDNTIGTTDQDIYLVTFNDAGPTLLGSSNQRVQYINNVLSSLSIPASNVVYYYDKLFTGCALHLTSNQLNTLKYDKNIKLIEKDGVINLDDKVVEYNPKTENLLAQTVSWGCSAVGGSVDASSSTGVAWIVDTGVYLTHSDLNVNTTLSKTFVKKGNDSKTANDLNGHGSHCAGIVAAKNNTIGNLGVCAGATVIGVKVLNSQGSGTYSDIIAGINYVAGNLISGKVNAVNMSFGGGVSSTLDNAVSALASNGAYVAIAAGNSTADCSNSSPARVNGTNIFTISAHNTNYALSSYSNYGAPVDYSAPGDNIYSCYKNNGYATMSGTSMATPHVTGILLANNGTINYSGTISGDKDSTPDKRAVR